MLRSSLSIPAMVCGVSLVMNKNMEKFSFCSDDKIPAGEYNWPFSGSLKSFDAMSIRRGFQIYRQICASCHSVKLVSFRQLVGVTHTEEQMKAIAESYDIEDGPNDQGEMFERPGKLSDKIPGPYKNIEQARAANNGALPPDLSLMTKARHDGANYVFSLLTGYVEPPHGKAILPGLHYNPYFPGGAIAMAKQLEDGQVDYEDGTPATEAQLAKDIVCFLEWCAEPEHDTRKKNGMKTIFATILALVAAGYLKRLRWSVQKTSKFFYVKK
jgi:ubiquinol-cytochrome c reductase cytochrome c1 subunit